MDRPHTARAARRRRWPVVLLVGTVLLGLLLGGATVALNRAYPPERLAALLAHEVRQATGRDFRIAGGLSVRVLPRIGVVARDVVLGNAAWSRRSEMVRVGRIELRIALWPLLSGRVAFERAAVDDVEVWLETNADGTGNWVFARGAGKDGAGAPPAPPSTASPGPALGLEEIELADARLSFVDARRGISREARLASFELHREQGGTRIESRFDVGGRTWVLKGRTGELVALAAAGADWPFDLTLSAKDASIRVEGRRHAAGAPVAASARVEARLTDAEALTPWLGAAPRIPMPLELRARLRTTTERADLDDIDLALAGQRVGGRASVRLASPWDVRAELAAKAIDLDRWMPAPRPAPPQAAAPTSPRRLFGAEPLPFDLLARVPAEIDVQVGELRRGGAPTLSAGRLRFVSGAGQARVEGLSLAMAGGTVTGRASVRPHAGAPAALTLTLSAKNLQAASLSQQSGAGDYLRGGTIDVSADLTSQGRSPSELAAGATGELLLSARDLTLREGAAPIGPNLLPMLLKSVRLDGGKAAPTHIECLVVRLPFKDGLAVVDRSIAVETEQLSIVAKGHVDLRDETLHLALRPSARQVLGLNTAQLASLVVVKGPLLEPHVGIDAQGAAGLALSIGAAAASGGLSVLGQNLLHQAVDPHPCRFAATGARSPAPAGAAGEPGAGKGRAGTSQKLPASLRELFGQGKARP